MTHSCRRCIAVSVAALLVAVALPAVLAQPKPGSTTGPATTQAAQWRGLFGNEKWYVSQAGEERVSAGKLEALPQDEGIASALMRPAQYRLGQHTLYTGGQRHKELDLLVGKPVEIRGKEVRMELEGQDLREIWPAAVRPAP